MGVGVKAVAEHLGGSEEDGDVGAGVGAGAGAGVLPVGISRARATSSGWLGRLGLASGWSWCGLKGCWSPSRWHL